MIQLKLKKTFLRSGQKTDYMINYNQKATDTIDVDGLEVSSFMKEGPTNLDEETVKSFGEEWNKFTGFDEKDLKVTGDQYFDIVDNSIVNPNSTRVLDVGCGSGRWSRYLSDKVKFIEAVDPSEAIAKASKFNRDKKNIRWTQASVDNIPFEDNSFDFVFSLGVLHHIPDTQQALTDAVKKLKPGGHFLLYLYYALDNRGVAYKLLFKMSNSIRYVISKLPGFLKRIVCDIIALVIYFPLVSLARLLKSLSKGNAFNKLPLSYYHDKSFHIMRNDALDRFGTPLEQRFTKTEIEKMMLASGLTDIKFSEGVPFWHALGKK